ncbi:hypothetical protein HANVADRAFT_3390 [Hanseniaspora valbyensis NRRL Y-1626]|uniref:RING-type E3 ubiquitin transferase n=1 Tax=Hanseniaspora valbyensis NRRL Y-1626 TaxID=766949 RepID=A0A1B7TAQ5_9ASCO|nr:hypothetical protein HANVADRAFT_3390 [Hanseniaspora valbyensis NRRL Y-1626]
MDSSNGKICRVCQEDENESGNSLLKPCKCNSYIHKSCLLRWTRVKSKSDIIDFENDLNCEICHTKIEFAYDAAKNGNTTSIKNTWDAINTLYKRNSDFFHSLDIIAFVLFVVIFVAVIINKILKTKTFRKVGVKTTKTLDSGITMTNQALAPRTYVIYLLEHLPHGTKSFYSNIFLTGCIFVSSLLPAIVETFDGFKTSTFYKMYEYNFGKKKASEEYENIEQEFNNNMDLRKKNSSFTKITSSLILAIYIGLGLCVHFVLQEFVPRCLYHKLVGHHAYKYTHYFTLYYNFVLALVLYGILTFKEKIRKSKSFKLFITKNCLKLIVVGFWKYILFHVFDLFFRNYLGMGYIINATYAYDLDLSSLFLTESSYLFWVSFAAIDYLRNKLFRYGVFYQFYDSKLVAGDNTKRQSLMVMSLKSSLKKYLLEYFMMFIALMGFGGIAVIGFYKFKPQIFPLQISYHGFQKILINGIVLIYINGYVSLLNTLLYQPFFKKISFIFKLTNYLFKVDDDLLIKEKTNSNNDKENIEEEEHKCEKNNLCLSKIEAINLFENKTKFVAATCASQNGFFMKVPSEQTDTYFSDGLMEKFDVKQETTKQQQQQEEEEEEDADTGFIKGTTDKRIYDYVNSGVNDDYEVCFVPNYFKIKLILFFLIISIMQNAAVFGILLFATFIGNRVCNIPWLLFFNDFTNKDDAEQKNLQDFTNKIWIKDTYEQYASLKLVIGLTLILGVCEIFISKFKKDDNKNMIKKFAVLIYSILYQPILLLILLLLCSITAILTTYTINVLKISLIDNIHSFPSCGDVKFLWHSIPMFLEVSTANLFLAFFLVSVLTSVIRFYLKVTNAEHMPDEFGFKAVSNFTNGEIKQYSKLLNKFLLKPFIVHNLVLVLIYLLLRSISFTPEALCYTTSPNLITKLYDANISLLFYNRSFFLNNFYRFSFLGHVFYELGKAIIKISYRKWVKLTTLAENNKVSEEDIIIIEQ